MWSLGSAERHPLFRGGGFQAQLWWHLHFPYEDTQDHGLIIQPQDLWETAVQLKMEDKKQVEKKSMEYAISLVKILAFVSPSLQ